MELQQLKRRIEAPSLDGATAWLQSDPLSWEKLRGRIVLVDFWTYGCSNCVRTLPHVRALHERLAPRGLDVVGIHSPEFASEKVRRNVEDALWQHKLSFPIAMDNDHAIWRRWAQRYWPTQYLVDRAGQVAYVHIGEGAYAEIERAASRLLEE